MRATNEVKLPDEVAYRAAISSVGGKENMAAGAAVKAISNRQGYRCDRIWRIVLARSSPTSLRNCL